MRDKLDSVIKNKYGFYELKKKPSVDELKKYYSEKYYQDNSATYSTTYTDEEIKYFFNKIEQKYFLLKDKIKNNDKPNILDIGCGEGFTLKFFRDLGWEITGLDYSTFGCRHHNPDVLDKILTGDFFENMVELKEKNKKFDLIWLDNVLEHVLDPFLLVKMCHFLCKKDSILLIEVPNDFSRLQEFALEKGFITEKFWIASPDHISYFNKDGLINLCDGAGWIKETIIGDFPIEINLLNEDSNYIKDNSKGKKSHHQRVAFENLLHEISIEKTNKLYEALADLGMGRSIIGIFKKNNEIL